MTQKYSAKLQEFTKLVKEQINIIENGGKLSSFKRDVKPRQKELKGELRDLIKDIAGNGQVNGDWVDIRNYFIIAIKDVLDTFNAKYNDSKTFQEEKEVILQYFVFFQKAPFTIQRISELTFQPQKYYRSTKKILYAYEKLVNVGDPDDR